MAATSRTGEVLGKVDRIRPVDRRNCAGPVSTNRPNRLTDSDSIQGTCLSACKLPGKIDHRRAAAQEFCEGSIPAGDWQLRRRFALKIIKSILVIRRYLNMLVRYVK